MRAFASIIYCSVPAWFNVWKTLVSTAIIEAGKGNESVAPAL